MAIKRASEISQGKHFPPEREAPRVRVLDKYFRYRNGQFKGLVPEATQVLRLEKNIFRLISNFWRDTLMADTPMFLYEGREHETIENMKTSLVAATRNVVEDMATYGYGVYLTRYPGFIENIDSRFYYPIREPSDFNVGDEAIVAYPYSDNTKNTLDSIVIEYYFGENNRVVTHHALQGTTIGPRKGETTAFESGRPVMAVFGEGIYGKSMYSGIEKHVAEIHRRESFVSEALDRAADPHLAVPENSLEQDDNGQYRLNLSGMVIPVPPDSSNPEYVVWDAKFDAQDKQVDRAWNSVLLDTAISPLLLNQDSGNRTPITGEAVRRLAIPTVNRTRELREDLSTAIKKVIYENGLLQGVEFNIDSITVEWPLEFSSLDNPQSAPNTDEVVEDEF